MAYHRCHDCCGVLAQQGNELFKLTVIQNCWTLMPYPIKGCSYAYLPGGVNTAHCSPPLLNGPWLQCFSAKHGSLYIRDKLLMRLLTFHHNYFLWERLGSPVSLQYVLMDQTRQELDTECSPFTSTRRLPIEAPYCLILLSHTMVNHTQSEQNADWVTLYNHCTLA